MLGSLEKRILSVLFKEKKTTARDIFRKLRAEGMAITYVTVNTVLSRLYKRGLINRISEPYRGSFRYTYEYMDLKEELINNLLGDVTLLFGEEGIDLLKMKLDTKKGKEQVEAKDKSKPVSDTDTMRICLSKNEIQNSIIKKIEDISGQKVSACYQCGKCSAGCPMINLMDLLPNQIIRLVQLGQIKEVLDSKTIWLCASCFTCSARCPKGVDLAKVMEALRLLLLRKSENYIEPSELDIDENLPQIALVSNLRKKTG
jgi:heterodisulfide reductase subunit C